MDSGTNRRQRDAIAKEDFKESVPEEDLPPSKRHHSHSMSPKASLSSPPPKYGSKIYWDDRYMKQFRQVSNVSCSSPALDNHESEVKEEDDGKDTLPYHSWYFTYDELRPILLPLLLGGRDEVQALLAAPETHYSCQDCEDTDEEEGVDAIAQSTQPVVRPIDAVPTISDHDRGGDSESDNEEDDFQEIEEEGEGEEDDEVWEEVVEMDDDDDDALPQRDGLAKAGPVAILEIGCGDVPLGAALALEFKELETTASETEKAPLTSLSIISKIVCTDYSQVVVDMMRRQYRTMCCGSIEAIPSSDTIVALATAQAERMSDVESLKVVDVGSVPLQFEVTDARKLPYEDMSFHLVLEKGALDAVLSDTVSGVSDCVQIVSECARVTSGCIVLISHLNAHTPSGLSWMEEVVFAGLRNSPTPTAVAWEVEVHGNADVTPDGEEDGSVSRIPSGTPGPAVYIIHKKAMTPCESNATVGTAPRIPAPINVQFFSYQ